MKRPPTHIANPAKAFFVIGVIIAFFTHRTAAAIRYWDTKAGANNGIGGSGTWGTTFSKSSLGDATLTTAATTDDVIFDGTAGTVTLDANQTAASLTINVTGYKITGNNTVARVLGGPISIGAGLNLGIGNNEASTIEIGVGSVSGGNGSGLTINASATGSSLTRLDLAANGATIGVPITVSGTGLSAIASTTTGTAVSGTITGNGRRLSLGASSGDIVFNNTIDNGVGTLRISAGSTGGTGIVTIASTGNVWGDTEINNDPNGILRLGVSNALPTATTLRFGAVDSGNSFFDLHGYDQTIGQLTNGAISGGTIKNDLSSTLSTLKISGTDTSAAAFSGGIIDGNGQMALQRGGSGTTILSGANTYTGNTTISSGTLKLSASGTIASSAKIIAGVGSNSSGKFDVNGINFALANGQTLAGTGTVTGAITVSSGSKITAGSGATSSDSIGALTTDGQTWAGGGTYVVKFGSGAAGSHPNSPRGGTNWDELAMSSLNVTAGTTASTQFIISAISNAGSNIILTANQQFGIAHFTTAVSTSVLSQLVLKVTGITDSDGSTPRLTFGGSGGTELYIESAPEPGTVILAGLSGMAVLGRRRRTFRVRC